jgi:hypothetical protein
MTQLETADPHYATMAFPRRPAYTKITPWKWDYVVCPFYSVGWSIGICCLRPGSMRLVLPWMKRARELLLAAVSIDPRASPSDHCENIQSTFRFRLITHGWCIPCAQPHASWNVRRLCLTRPDWEARVPTQPLTWVNVPRRWLPST